MAIDVAEQAIGHADSSLSVHASARMLHEANDSVADRGGVRASSDQSQSQWHNASLDCGTLEQLYGQTKDSQHPFTPAEIALAGSAAAVVLNQNEAELNGSAAALDGNQGAPSWKNGDVPANLPANYNDNISRILGISSFMSTSKGETAPQVRDDVIQNLSQTGSGGVDQAGLGDCWFEGPLASLAANPKGQEDIAKMIERNTDGSYTVDFPGASREITVQPKDLQNANIQNSATWANILETAMDKAIPKDAENGLAPELGSYLLTGHKSTSVEFSPVGGRGEQQQPNETEWIQSQLSEGKIVTAATDPNNGPVEGDHVYSVLGIKPGSGGGPSFVEVRNPWGGQDKEQSTGATDAAAAKNKPDVGQTVDGVQNLGGGVLLIPSNKISNYLPYAQSDQP